MPEWLELSFHLEHVLFGQDSNIDPRHVDKAHEHITRIRMC